MTKAYFYYRNGTVSGFKLCGHTDDEGDADARIVCAAISSAAYMAVNTVTDIIGVDADIEVNDCFMQIDVKDTERARAILDGFKLHMDGLAEQYPNFIQILTEVQHNA